VQVKVDVVRDVMVTSVSRALNSVEKLEEMDEKAELFEDKSKTFLKRSTLVQEEQKRSYRTITLLVALAIIAIIIYLIYIAVNKYKQAHPDTPTPVPDVSSSSTGVAGARRLLEFLSRPAGQLPRFKRDSPLQDG
jgi:hypothetical protein